MASRASSVMRARVSSWFLGSWPSRAPPRSSSRSRSRPRPGRTRPGSPRRRRGAVGRRPRTSRRRRRSSTPATSRGSRPGPLRRGRRGHRWPNRSRGPAVAAGVLAARRCRRVVPRCRAGCGGDPDDEPHHPVLARLQGQLLLLEHGDDGEAVSAADVPRPDLQGDVPLTSPRVVQVERHDPALPDAGVHDDVGVGLAAVAGTVTAAGGLPAATVLVMTVVVVSGGRWPWWSSSWVQWWSQWWWSWWSWWWWSWWSCPGRVVRVPAHGIPAPGVPAVVKDAARSSQRVWEESIHCCTASAQPVRSDVNRSGAVVLMTSSPMRLAEG